MINKLWIFTLKTGGFEKKKHFGPFFNSVFFINRTCFFKKTHLAQHACVDGLAVVLQQSVQEHEGGELQRTLVLPEKTGQHRQGVAEDGAQVNAQGRRGHVGERLDGGEARDFVTKALQKDGQACGELVLR